MRDLVSAIENDRDEVAVLRRTAQAIYAEAAASGRAPSQRDVARAEDLVAKADALDARVVKHARELEDRSKRAVADAQRVDTPPMGGGKLFGGRGYPEGRSFLRDLANAHRGDSHAAQLIAAHDDVRREQLSGETRLLTTGGAGAFVPDIFDAGQGFAYAGAPFWTWTQPGQLPDEGMSIEVPTVTAAMSAGAQTSQGSAVANSTPSIGTATANVVTMAASTIASFQALERATDAFDQVLFGELSRAYVSKVEADALGGAGGATFNGVAAGSATVSVGTADATGAKFIGKLAEGMADVTGSVFEDVAGIFMAPRRWAWLAQQVDDSKQPYIKPLAPAQGTSPELTAVYGNRPVGYAFGAPVYTTGGMTLTAGDGQDEDRVLIVARNSVRTWQASELPQRVTLDVDALTLRYRLTVYGYVAMAVTRPSGLAVLGGPGLADPFA